MLLTSRPAPALQHLIRYYFQFETVVVGEPARQPVPARSPPVIEFTFGEPYAVRRLDQGGLTRNAYPIALVGAQTFRRVELLSHGRVDTFTVVFQPAGISRFFSIPAAEITNADFEGEVVLGHGLCELHRQLGDVSSFSDRVRVADEYLCAKRPAFDSASGIARAAMTVHVNSGCVRVAKLADNSGLSIRQFERHFRHEIGVTPKLYTRIVRFEAALRRKALRPESLWSEIAQTLGYHDQMHMVHDFKRLSGDSPTTICEQLGMFVTPEVDLAARSR